MGEWDFEPHMLYRIYDGFDRPLYFGETSNLPRRLAEHWEKAWFRRSEITIKVNMFPNRAEALAAESRAIAAEKPWYNKVGLTPSTEAHPRAPKIAATSKAPKSRDLLADVATVLGDGVERVRVNDLPHLLRQLAPEYEAYRNLTGKKFRCALTEHGIRTTNTDNRPQLDPADFRSAYGVEHRMAG